MFFLFESILCLALLVLSLPTFPSNLRISRTLGYSAGIACDSSVTGNVISTLFGIGIEYNRLFIVIVQGV